MGDELAKIYGVVQGDMTTHRKVVNIWKLTNDIKDFPKLPPDICPCRIELKNGNTFIAYLDTDFNEDWIEYGNTIRVQLKGRRNWKIEDVVKWEFL